MNILLIEPDLVLAATYSSALELDGHQVVHANQAQASLHAIDRVLPDLVILEIQLAGHSGIEFLYELRSYTDWQRIPIIIHTVVPIEALGPITSLRMLGVDSVLYKPQTTLQQLKSLVATVSQTVTP